MSHRAVRLGEEMKKEIAQMLRDELKDPRIGFVTVTKVDVANDLGHAKVFVSILGSEEEKRQSMQALIKATGFVRSEIARRIRLRYAPEIVFKLDESIEQGVRIASLLEQVKGKNKPEES